ncbi:hypothetical protein [Paenibacillus sp. MMO-58]
MNHDKARFAAAAILYGFLGYVIIVLFLGVYSTYIQEVPRCQ